MVTESVRSEPTRQGKIHGWINGVYKGPIKDIQCRAVIPAVKESVQTEYRARKYGLAGGRGNRSTKS